MLKNGGPVAPGMIDIPEPDVDAVMEGEVMEGEITLQKRRIEVPLYQRGRKPPHRPYI